MVVLIGNPVCCCAFAACGVRCEGATELTEPKEALPPCCRAKAEQSCPDSDEVPSHSCPCAKKLGATPTEPLVVPEPSAGAPLPAPRPDGSLSLHLPKADAFLALRPPDEADSGAAPPVRLLYGVFRC
jgi:hypothetical protein